MAIFGDVMDWIYPRRCLLCTAPGQALCSACAMDLPTLPAARCRACALPLATQAGAVRCGRCQQRAPAFTQTCAAFAYTTPMDRLIQGWKYGRRLPWTAPLAAQWLSAQVVNERPQALIPVPLHWRRLWMRGFNQAGLLADHWGRHWDIPVLHGQARRIRNTAQQTQLQPQQRRANLSGAFVVKALKLDHVAIVDDVMTTGSTSQALAAVLLQAGVGRVDVWVLARTVSD